jgi:protein-tyrosine phosphatase
LIDIHTHILPGVDDGVQSLDEAISILRKASKEGIQRVVFTPHVLEAPSARKWHEISRTCHRLSRHIQQENLPIAIHLGAELFVSPDLPRMIEENPALTIDCGKKYALFELPASEIPPFTLETVYRLLLRGIVPILAHPERNLEIQAEPGTLLELIQKGLLTQLNAASLSGKYGKNARKTAKILLAHDLIHLMGSDLHALPEGPYPLLEGIDLASRIVGKRQATEMVTTIPEKILNGEAIDHPRPKPIRKRFLSGLLS